jgi:hypothetical protein
VILGPDTAAASECQAGFERWSKLSQARVRLQGRAAGGSQRSPSQAACAPGEGVRQELLKALARVRARCNEAASDPVAPATRTMIEINEGFIRSLPLCRAEEAAPGAAPKPAAASPPPSSTPPAATPAVSVPPASAPAASPEAEPDGPLRRCLYVTRISRERYALSNRWCGGNTVLAIVETRGASGEIECRAHAIGQRATVRSLNNAAPQINHECLWSQGNCTKDNLDSMFPECDW